MLASVYDHVPGLDRPCGAHHDDGLRRLASAMALQYPDPDLADPIVRLRRWSEDDLGCIEQAATDRSIPTGTTVPAVFTVEAGIAFIHRQWSRLDNSEGLSWAIADVKTGDALGLVVLMLRSDPEVAGIGYWIIPRARRRSLATRAIELASSWALRDAGLARVEGLVHCHNEVSQRSLIAAGFEQEGILRHYFIDRDRRVDAVVFSRVQRIGPAPTTDHADASIPLSGTGSP